MHNNPVVWFEIHVDDLARAQAFYEAVLELELSHADHPTPDDKELRIFPMHDERSGATGALVRLADTAAGGNSTLVYFACDDCAAAARRAAEHGGQIFKDKHSIAPHGFVALVYDPEGNLFGLHSMQ